MTNLVRFFVMTSSKNKHISDFQFSMIRFEFLVSLQDPIINCYKKLVLELPNRVYSFKNHQNTKNRENAIFSSLWVLIESLKFIEILTTYSIQYVDYGKTKFKWPIFSFYTWQTLQNAILCQKCLKWL